MVLIILFYFILLIIIFLIKITIEFSTSGGDIKFSLIFSPLYCISDNNYDDVNNKVDNENNDEVIIPPSRLPSDVKICSGSYEAKSEGTLLFVFDNTYSWFNTKLLNYCIYLYEPAFDSADNSRSLRSRKLLDKIIKENTIAEKRLGQTQDRILSLRDEIDMLKVSISECEEILHHKKEALEYAIHEIEDMTARIAINEEKIDGLCIRSLGKYETSIILSFLSNEYRCVCKYWNLIYISKNQEET